MTADYQVNWNLDELFPGGSQSESFAQFLTHINEQAASLHEDIQRLCQGQADGFVAAFLDLQTLQRDMEQARSFVGCLTADDMGDAGAARLEKQVDALGAGVDSVAVQFDATLAALPTDVLKQIQQDPRMGDVLFAIEERIQKVRRRLDPAREALAADLRVDGYQGWERLYYTVLNSMSVPYTHDGKTEMLSMGQAANKLGDAERVVRQAVFPAWSKAWADKADILAEALNHIAGFRLALYQHRGWTNILQEPLEKNRVSAELLNTMWSTIDLNKAPVVAYLKRKARILGVDKLEWFDFAAPLPDEVEKDRSFAEASEFVVEQFSRFSQDMGDFARMALQSGWVEAEDRTGKRTGAFCTDFPTNGQSRVFMTFSGTFDNMSTLAHELGHAYHSKVLRGLPYFASEYPMSLAESASTFAEAVIVGAALRETDDVRVKIYLLDQKIQNAVTFFMDIHSRFLFETRFYEARHQGPLTVPELCNLMENAQKDAFCGALKSYHPYFWASKLHFYDTTTPFYNFPYTIGFLFSSGLYARSLEEGPSFAQRYTQILRDTGRMTMEDLAKRHLDVDLSKPDFWQSAIDVLHKDIDEFLRLTEEPSH